MMNNIDSKDLNVFKLRKHTQQENAIRCNNRDDLLQLSFTLKISIFLEAYK